MKVIDGAGKNIHNAMIVGTVAISGIHTLTLALSTFIINVNVKT